MSMALTLLVCSILLFFKHWKKNYRDINQLPYYAYLYQKEEVQFEPEVSEEQWLYVEAVVLPKK